MTNCINNLFDKYFTLKKFLVITMAIYFIYRYIFNKFYSDNKNF